MNKSLPTLESGGNIRANNLGSGRRTALKPSCSYEKNYHNDSKPYMKEENCEELPRTHPEEELEQGWHDYISDLAEATKVKLRLIMGPEAANYRLKYDQAATLGNRLLAWRMSENLDRTTAASRLVGWSKATLTLMEQGMILPEQISSEMLQSLYDIADI